MTWSRIKNWFSPPRVNHEDLIDQKLQPFLLELEKTEKERRKTILQIMASLGESSFGNECDLEKEFKNMFGTPSRSN